MNQAEFFGPGWDVLRTTRNCTPNSIGTEPLQPQSMVETRFGPLLEVSLWYLGSHGPDATPTCNSPRAVFPLICLSLAGISVSMVVKSGFLCVGLIEIDFGFFGT